MPIFSRTMPRGLQSWNPSPWAIPHARAETHFYQSRNVPPARHAAFRGYHVPMDTPNAFSPEFFRAQAHAVVNQLADHLARATRRAPMPVLPPDTADALVEHWPDRFPSNAAPDPVAALTTLLDDVLTHSNHLHHPHYVGHRVTAPPPQAAVTELFSALLNNVMAVYEMGPVSTAMERSLIRWLGAQCGFDRTRTDGVFTSGGSAGNLTALLAARQERAGFDAWHGGHTAGPPLAILAGESAHYSVKRAVQMMGWLEGQVPLPMRPVHVSFR